MGNKRYLKVIAILTAFTLTVGLAGCGSNSDTSGTDTSTATGETSKEELSGTITVGGWPSGDDAFQAALSGFNEAYPKIEVVFDFTDTTAYHQALQTSLAAGSGAPDVAMVEGAYIAQYRDSMALTNLLDTPYQAGDLKDDFVSYKFEQAYSVDDSRLVAVPWDIGPCTYFYRTDIFEECGLPTDPEEVASLMSTWDGVLEVAEKVYIPGERWLLPNASYLYQLMFCNRDFYNEDLTLKIDREGDIDCLNAVIKMRENQWDMNVDMWSTEAYAGYSSGACASVATGAWFGGFLKTDIDPEGTGNWGVAKLYGGIESSNWGGSFLCIPEQSENKEAAWAFIEYMLATAEGQNDMFQAVDYYPAYKPAWDDSSIYEAEDPYFGGQKAKVLWTEIASDLKPVFNTMMDTTAEGCIYTSVNAGLEQGMDAQQIKDLLAADIEAASGEVKNSQIQIYKDAGLWKE